MRKMTRPVPGSLAAAAVAAVAAVAASAAAAVFLRRVLRRAPGGQRGPWQALREDTARARYTLTPAVFERARRLFLDLYAHGKTSPAALTVEYLREEFLLVVDEQGRPTGTDAAIIDSFRAAAAARPEFRRWFAEARLEAGEQAGQPVLLAARWLCHLTGLRHGTVEIFIDPPQLPGYTLVQVRGMEKYEAPGAFDIPCAGHITGLDAPDAALVKELGEELNLTLGDLDDFRGIGRYNSIRGGGAADEPFIKMNNEHRVLYQARIKPEAVARIRFTDGEVAGLAVFLVSELRALVEQFPERVASGLGDAMAYYEAD